MDRMSGVLLHSIPPDAERLGIPRAFVHLSECQFDIGFCKRSVDTHRHTDTHGYKQICIDMH